MCVFFGNDWKILNLRFWLKLREGPNPVIGRIFWCLKSLKIAPRQNYDLNGLHIQREGGSFKVYPNSHVWHFLTLLSSDRAFMQETFSILKISGDPASVTIPIIVSIFIFPFLVILTLCCIKVKNYRAREKVMKDWLKKNRAKEGIHLFRIYFLKSSVPPSHLAKYIYKS